jgi:hypothetical protein
VDTAPNLSYITPNMCHNMPAVQVPGSR